MRLHRLEITAFGPFAGHEVIDFEPLNEAGLFLLNGVTGAGKTSVLDALCFALYGTVPGGRAARALRSHHAEPTAAPEVQLEFTAAGRRFLLTRSPYWEAPSTRAASGTAVRQPKALLQERGTDGGWEAKATRLDDVGELVKEVVGLSKEQFTQVILLPQGEFAEFLRASSADREAVLKRLFGTASYERVQEELVARSRTARAAAESAAAESARIVRDAERELGTVRSLDPGGEAAAAEAPEESPGDEPDAGAAGAGALGVREGGAGEGGAAAAVAAVLARARDAEERGRALHAALDARLHEVERRAADFQEQLRLWRRLAELRREETELAAGRSEAEERRKALDRHRAAVPLRVVLDARRRAQDGLDRARELRARALADVAADGLLRTAPAALLPGHEDAAAAALAGEDRPAPGLRAAADQALAGVRAVRRREAELAGLADAVERLTEEEAAMVRQAAELDARAARQDAERTALERTGAELGPRAAAAPDLRRRADEAARVLEASRELAAAGARHDHELARYEEAERERRSVAQHAEQLQQRRFEEAAGLLAAELEDGVPCPVCGSAEHPAPADTGGAGTVTEDALRAALARRDTTAEAAETARRALGTARDAVTRLRAAGAADDPAAAQDAARAAAAEAEGAESAARQLGQAQAGLERLRAERDRTARALHDADVARSTATATLEQTRTQHDALAAELAEHARGFAGLPGKEAAAAHLVATLARLGEAHDALARAEETDRDAAAQLRTALQDSSFADEADLAGALLEPGTAQEQQRHVEEFEGRALRVAAQLAAAELTGVLEQEAAGATAPDPGALDRARTELSDLHAQRDASTGRLAGLTAARERLARLAEEAGTADAATARASAAAATLRELAETANGTSSDNALRMTLNSFVLAAQLEEVAAAAAVRLERMTGGRYRIVHSDAKDGGRKSGLGLQVEDAWTNARRGTESLSGGETFMASLALALGLADVVQAQAGGVEIDTLFVDEGFGSLDEETLEEVLDTIDGLRERGRVIGLVSHVQEMKARIPHQILVRRSPRGSTLAVTSAGSAV
ncbi:nuclease SbcCD subunit C [Kocuria dechangensis]|uniref:Nuclease SbcCD subunit C n=1 Tax=Kocuria dechangensis TaxID=1176249 RepID=A0A917GUG3_9MICC|nr:AAA family ATPase [Kocuria dechangensis]GGG57326.1 nuclease SbcCD subunit C [Kocuria dechangensis]